MKSECADHEKTFRKLKSKVPTLIQLLRDKTAQATFEEPVVVEATTVQHESDNLWYVHLQFPGDDGYYTGSGFESQAVAEDTSNWGITEFTPPHNLTLKFVIRPNDGWILADPKRIADEEAADDMGEVSGRYQTLEEAKAAAQKIIDWIVAQRTK